jgi:hypothetical protein
VHQWRRWPDLFDAAPAAGMIPRLMPGVQVPARVEPLPLRRTKTSVARAGSRESLMSVLEDGGATGDEKKGFGLGIFFDGAEVRSSSGSITGSSFNFCQCQASLELV